MGWNKISLRCVLSLIFILLLSFFSFACTCDDPSTSSGQTDDDDTSIGGDDDVVDDDTSDDDTGDDDTTDDDSVDDDSVDDDSVDDDSVDDDSVDDDSIDDDSVDDDSVDDDSTDDDSVDDDTTDDDTTDDDTVDDDTGDDDTGDDDTSDLIVEKIEGYLNGFDSDTSLVIAADGEFVVTALDYDEITINRGYPDQQRQEEILADDAQYPHLAVDTDNRAFISYSDDETYDLKVIRETAGGYVIETIDDSHSVYINDIAVHGGMIYVAYADIDSEQLILATDAGGSWSWEIVDDSASICDLSICVDHNGYVIIAYGKWAFDDGKIGWELHVASNRSGTWVRHDIPTTTGNGILIDMDLDAQGYSHIVHRGGQEIRYTTNLNGTWATDSVYSCPGNETPINTSLTLDSQGRPRIVFQADDGDMEHVYYSDKLFGYWNSFSPTAWDRLEYPSLAVDDDDNIYFVAIKRMDLYLVSYIDGQIDNRMINVMRRAEKGATLALDSLARPHVAYLLSDDFDVDPYMLYYGRKIGGEWTRSHIATAGECAGRAVLTLDAQNHAHIVHLSKGAAKRLMYTTNASGDWTTEIVDAAGDMYVTFWQTLDSAGRVHILYRDNVTSEMRVARQTASGWQIETIAAGYPSYPDAMAFDNAGRLHVIFSALNYEIVYGLRTGDTWVLETPATALGDIDGQSLAVDGAGHPHILYFDRFYSMQHMTNAGGDWESEFVKDMGDSEGLSLTIDGDDHLYACVYHYSNFYYLTNRTGVWTSARAQSDYAVQRHNSIEVVGDRVHAINNQSSIYHYRFPVSFPGNE